MLTDPIRLTTHGLVFKVKEKMTTNLKKNLYPSYLIEKVKKRYIEKIQQQQSHRVDETQQIVEPPQTVEPPQLVEHPQTSTK